jgi:hypothetical protein
MGVSVVSPVSEFIRLTCARSPRVMLVTDAASRDSVPESIRGVVDDAQYGNLSWMNGSTIPSNIDGAMIWCKGETPMTGSPGGLEASIFFWAELQHLGRRALALSGTRGLAGTGTPLASGAVQKHDLESLVADRWGEALRKEEDGLAREWKAVGSALFGDLAGVGKTRFRH